MIYFLINVIRLNTIGAFVFFTPHFLKGFFYSMTQWETIHDRSSHISPVRLVQTKNYSTERGNGIFEGKLEIENLNEVELIACL